MSRFSEYYDWTVTARKCLNGEPPPGHLATFQVWRGLIRFPLAGAEHSSRVDMFYGKLLEEVEGSRLDETRRTLYRKFTCKVVSAHVALEENQTNIGTISKLQTPLTHLAAALRLVAKLKEYDDEHPVHWSEVFPTQSVKSNLSPDELWFHFKLESIRPCLVFLVRLLRLVLPYHSDTWNECEESLTRKEWMDQFILDSPRPLNMPIPLSPSVVTLLADQAERTRTSSASSGTMSNGNS